MDGCVCICQCRYKGKQIGPDGMCSACALLVNWGSPLHAKPSVPVVLPPPVEYVDNSAAAVDAAIENSGLV